MKVQQLCLVGAVWLAMAGAASRALSDTGWEPAFVCGEVHERYRRYCCLSYEVADLVLDVRFPQVEREVRMALLSALAGTAREPALVPRLEFEANWVATHRYWERLTDEATVEVRTRGTPVGRLRPGTGPVKLAMADASGRAMWALTPSADGATLHASMSLHDPDRHGEACSPVPVPLECGLWVKQPRLTYDETAIVAAPDRLLALVGALETSAAGSLAPADALRETAQLWLAAVLDVACQVEGRARGESVVPTDLSQVERERVRLALQILAAQTTNGTLALELTHLARDDWGVLVSWTHRIVPAPVQASSSDADPPLHLGVTGGTAWLQGQILALRAAAMAAGVRTLGPE